MLLNLVARLVFFDFSVALQVHICMCMLMFKSRSCLCYFFCSFCVFFVHFKIQRHLVALLLCCLVCPCKCIFCSFATLVCFVVKVRCTGEFAACFVGPHARIMKFYLCMSHANVLLFFVVVAHAYLLHERIHTLVSACALAHALNLAYNFVLCTWFYRLLS